MNIRHQERKTARLFSISEKHRGKSQKNSSDSKHEATYKLKIGAKANWGASSTKHVHLEISQKRLTFLQNP